MAIKKFIVADNAPPWVAGRRVSPGDVLTLPEEDASYEIARGLLRPAGAATAAKAEATRMDTAAKPEQPLVPPARARKTRKG